MLLLLLPRRFGKQGREVLVVAPPRSDLKGGGGGAGAAHRTPENIELKQNKNL